MDALSTRDFWCYAALLASGAIYAVFAAGFFPAPPGRIGSDYAYFLPLTLAGKYWIAANGVFAAPLFTPAFCGGVPLLANPQSIFYSAPQAFALFLDVEQSFLATTVLFAWLGGLGTFLLMRQRFAASVPASCVSAVIFLFNGFLLHRMIIGQPTYHPVGLLPLLAYVLLTPLPRGPDRAGHAAAAIAAGGAIIAYFAYAGALNIMVPLAMAIVAIWLLHALIQKPLTSFWLIGSGAAAIAIAASAAKIVPAMAFLSNFPRPEDILVFPTLHDVLSALVGGLFFPPMLRDFVPEMEFSTGLVPPLLLLAGACVAIARGALRREVGLRSALALLGLVILLAIPIWLNYGSPEFAAWLKTLPYIGRNRLLVRWFFVYQLVLTVGAGLVLDYLLSEPWARTGAALASIAGVVLPALLIDQSYYRQPPYDPAPILAAERALRETGAPPAIIRIGGAARDDDGLVAGESAAQCYEPVFGYWLQSFPPGLQTGPLSLAGHHLRNPACYVYGTANDCAPGDRFSPLQTEAEAAFAAYRPFAYRRPWWQLAADVATVLGLTAIIFGFTWGLCPVFRARLPHRIERSST